MKKFLKQEKGINLISLTITIIIILIITGMLIFNARDSIHIKNLQNMYNDISTLREKVSLYYSQYGAIPAKYEFTNISNLETAGVLGANDTGKFYIIDLKALPSLTLNYGKDYYKAEEENSDINSLQDIYIINETSHNIFYVQGVSVKSGDTTNVYYTDEENIDTAEVDIKPLPGEYDGYVNVPELLTGMTAIKFNEPTETEKGSLSTDLTDGWYDYEAKKWANAQTEDGSLWVWIPRYAYKITYYTGEDKKTVSSTKTQYGSIDVKFLIGTTDQYYDENGEVQTAQRAKTADEIIDTTKNYTVHPAFTDESGIGYANGGWDEELSGIWVAKFEAGYASGNNEAPVKESSMNYTMTSIWAPSIESDTNIDAYMPARNWLDKVYAVKNDDETFSWKDGKETSIKYPTFQGKTYSMNYINYNDAFNISKVLNESGNIYGLNSDSDSHLMKNSEWGAVAYLAQSQFGLNGSNIYINNANLNNSTQSVYAITGLCSATGADSTQVITTIEKINALEGNTSQDNLYAWNQLNGQKASTTGTIYGVFDMSGGTWERTAGYIANENENLKKYGKSLTYNGEKLKTESTKYSTVYPHSDLDAEGTAEELKNTVSQENFEKNTKIYGDTMRETSLTGTGNTSWYQDYSYYPALESPFTGRGGYYVHAAVAGLFISDYTDGTNGSFIGFRSVLCAN